MPLRFCGEELRASGLGASASHRAWGAGQNRHGCGPCGPHEGLRTSVTHPPGACRYQAWASPGATATVTFYVPGPQAAPDGSDLFRHHPHGAGDHSR
eukprot:4268100-Pyramimonas_sp.AAC.1